MLHSAASSRLSTPARLRYFRFRSRPIPLMTSCDCSFNCCSSNFCRVVLFMWDSLGEKIRNEEIEYEHPCFIMCDNLAGGISEFGTVDQSN